ncbi:MAG: ABC transporter substrate-binding protein [Chloroflexi bacterium]|nr:ABC transporter substrate-binding protein [Chloroflexota bacterium]
MVRGRLNLSRVSLAAMALVTLALVFGAFSGCSQPSATPSAPSKSEPAKAAEPASKPPEKAAPKEAAAPPAAPAKKAPVKMRVGATGAVDWGTTAFEYVAARPDIQQKYGIEIEYKPFPNAGDKYNAFKAKTIDLDANMGVAPAASNYQAGVPLVVTRLWAVAEMFRTVVKGDSPYKDLADLKGSKFGITTKAASTYQVAYYAFKSKGLDPEKDVNWVTLPPAALMTALEKGDIQAFQLQEPFPYKIMKTGNYRIIAYPYEIYHKAYGAPFYQTSTAVRKDFYEANSDAVWGLNQAMLEALNNYDKEEDAIAKAVSESPAKYGVKPDEVKEIYKSMARVWVKQEIDDKLIAEVQTLYDRLLQIGGLEKPAKASEFFVKPPKR